MLSWEQKFAEWTKQAVVSCSNTQLAQLGVELLMDYSAEKGPVVVIVGDASISISLYTELVDYLKERKKIQAIKRFREESGLGLKASKEAMDKLEGELLMSGEIPPVCDLPTE